jgi:hypothetical protein
MRDWLEGTRRDVMRNLYCWFPAASYLAVLFRTRAAGVAAMHAFYKLHFSFASNSSATRRDHGVFFLLDCRRLPVFCFRVAQYTSTVSH